MKIRFATPADGPALRDIYAQYIMTAITFETSLPTEQEFSQRVAAISAFYPYLVCEKDGVLIGYAYAHRHKERDAYQWGAELSAYLDEHFTAKGLGKRLCTILIEILKLQGIKTVYGGVTLPNAKSEALHASLNFRTLGTYRNAGYKNGKWHDVALFEKQIAPYDDNPKPITPINAIPKEQLQQIIAAQ